MGSVVRRVARVVVGLGIVCAVGVAALVSTAGSGTAPASAAASSATAPAGLRPVDGVELTELRTARSRTWVKPNGMRVARVYEQPVSFRDGAGRWRLIDPELERSGEAWVNRANDFSVSIPDRLGDGPVRVARRGRWLEMRLRGDDAAAVVDGNVASFEGVARGVTARWTSHARQLKEELVLADRQAPSSFVFDVKLSDGLRLVDGRRGSLEAVGPNGGVAFVLAPPFAVDAAGARTPEGAASMRAERGDGGWVVRVAVEERWLDAPERAYPVTVDPTIYPLPVAGCQLDEEDATTSDCSTDSLTVGHENGRALHDHRGLLYFDVVNAVPTGANILSATLWAYATGKSGSSTSPIAAHRITSSWYVGVSWNRRDTTNSWTTAGGDFEATPEDVSAAPVVNDWTGWNLIDVVRDWHDGSQADQGVLLRDEGSSVVNATTFASGEHANSSLWPAIEVWYSPRTGRMDDYTFDTQALSDRQTLSVNVASGNMLLSSQDLEIKGVGMDLAVERAFNSGDDWVGQMGFGGRLSVGKDVELLQCDDTESMCFFGPSGYHMRFEKLSDGSFQTPPAGNARLVRNRDDSYTMTFLRTGIVYRFFASQSSFLTDVVDPNGNTIHFDYTSSELSQIDDTQGREIDVTRNGDGDITMLEDPEGRQWRYGYSMTGRKLTSVTDPEGNVTAYQFDGNDDIDLITDGRGNETHIAYDRLGRVSSVTREVDGGAGDVVTSFAYSGATSPCGAAGDVGKTVVTNPRGEDTTYCWNALGQVTSVHDALGRETTQSFTENRDQDEIVEHADTGNPATTDIDYNANDDVTAVTAPSGEEETTTYWSAGSNTNDPLRDRRVESVTGANGVDEFYDYDDYGNLIAVKDDDTTPRNQASLAYNGDGTLDTFTDGEGHRTTFDYDVDGNLIEVIPPSVSSPGTLGSTVYTYDTLGRVETVTDGRGETLTYTYDDLDRMTRVEAEDSSWISFAYDENGNLLERESSGGSLTRYTYDKLNRQTEEDLPGAAYNQYGYDKNGNVTSIVDQSGTVTYAYDDVDRVTSIVSPRPGGGTDTVTYAYADPDRSNAFSTRTATLPSGATQRVEQDLSGKITDILLRDRSSSVLAQRTYDYTAGVTESTLVQTMLDQAGNRTTYTYADRTEDVGRLLKARTEDRSSALVTEYRYAFDKNGNRTTREVETSGGTTTETYAYNAANQLCWSYTGVSANGCATAPRGATSFTYDAAGNQLTGNNTLTWDPYGRLGSIDRTSLTNLSLTNDVLSGFGSETLQDNTLGLSRHDDGRTATSIVRDPETGLPVSQNDGTAKRWYTADNIGTTIALTDDTSAQTRSYAYDPDGVVTSGGSGPDAVARFAGGHLVGTTGLYHFGARYYDPAIARWTSRDPLEQYTDLRNANRYGYAGGDPVNLVDREGLQPSPCGSPRGKKAVYCYKKRKKNKKAIGCTVSLLGAGGTAIALVLGAPVTLPAVYWIGTTIGGGATVYGAVASCK